MRPAEALTLSDGWVDETWRSGSSDTIAALWCAVCPLPVLIILSLGVKEEWRWEGGGLWWWRLVGWPNIPRGQGTDGTWLPPHKSLPRKLRPAPVTVSKWRQLFTQTRGESRVEGMRGKIERLQSNTGKINSKLALSKEYYPVWHLGLNWNLFLHCLWKGVKCHVKEIGACW